MHSTAWRRKWLLIVLDTQTNLSLRSRLSEVSSLLVWLLFRPSSSLFLQLLSHFSEAISHLCVTLWCRIRCVLLLLVLMLRHLRIAVSSDHCLIRIDLLALYRLSRWICNIRLFSLLLLRLLNELQWCHRNWYQLPLVLSRNRLRATLDEMHHGTFSSTESEEKEILTG